MKESNKTKLDTGTSILFLIFNRAWWTTIGEFERPDELRHQHKTLVVGTCRILEWLGLVVPDRTLAFGCKPTNRLEEIVVKRGLRRLKNTKNVRPSIEDEDVLHSIFDAAVSDQDQPYVCPLACDVLDVLGLVTDADGGEIPTQELRQLAAERREGDRTKQWLKAIEAGEWPPK
jgi:hypothetical protein